MKIIFLDFDGVIVTDRSIKMRKQYGNAPFDPVAVANLNALIASTGASIVLSTSWRTDLSLDMKQVLTWAGVRCNIIGQTPVLGGRGYEIAAWLDAHAKGIQQFVILDDTRDQVLLGRLANNFVLTTMESGFDADALHRALRILGNRRTSPAGLTAAPEFTSSRWRKP
jgi:hypothetical protein